MEPEPISIASTASGAGVEFSREERERHVYIVGKSGSGKSTFLFNLAMGDISRGEGVAVIDPHGDLALDILDAIPRSRINDVCYLDATDTEQPVGFNPATRIAPERRALAAAGIVSAFKHLWSDSWGPRLEHFLYHGIAATPFNTRPSRSAPRSRLHNEQPPHPDCEPLQGRDRGAGIESTRLAACLASPARRDGARLAPATSTRSILCPCR